jgi:anion-transporting  ArsA/GET3 family ATPase
MQRLYEIHNSGRYDLIVVDTPPTRNAIDFLEAPERMADFFSSRLLRWLITPYKSRVLNLASKPFYSVADRILGSQFLEDIAEFFVLFQTMYDGFVERAEAVTALLGGPQTTFVVVSTLEVAPAREAEFFLELLAERRYHVGALVLNKVLPQFLLDQEAQDAATKMRNESEKLAVGLVGSLGDPEPDRTHVTHVLSEMGQNFLDYQVVARREAEQRTELSASPELTLTVPYLDDDIHSLRGLLDLGERIWR